MKYFSSKILMWYDKNKRDLPWRETEDPYKIWISEIVLQQTRVNQGLPYYVAFVNRFPNIQSLANASEQEVLKLWQGLGYYSRARNMHSAAKEMVEKYQGIFPENYNQILSLKGVGEYTAKAISVFAYHQKHVVTDANVNRIIARLYGIKTDISQLKTKQKIQKTLEKLLDTSKIVDFNQAIMEFGALQCLPRNPKCENCIFKNDCYAFKTKTTEKLPVKKKKKELKHRYFHYFVFIDNNHQTLIRKRVSDDIWTHLYEFPMMEHHKGIPDAHIFNYILNKNDTYTLRKNFKTTHVLSHQKIHARFFVFDCSDASKIRFVPNLSGIEKIPVSNIDNFPLPKLIEQYISNILFN
jgi:A/G-specific adenine glycosylase